MNIKDTPHTISNIKPLDLDGIHQRTGLDQYGVEALDHTIAVLTAMAMETVSIIEADPTMERRRMVAYMLVLGNQIDTINIIIHQRNVIRITTGHTNDVMGLVYSEYASDDLNLFDVLASDVPALFK